MDIQAQLTLINAQHGTTFQAAEPLAGGYQEGAWRITDLSGRVAVLKRTAVPRSLPVVRRLRAAGYPAPDFLYYGDGPDGSPYLVQEFLPGTPLSALTPEYTRQLIALNRLQANLNPESKRPEDNWSDYARNVMFADESGWASCLRGYSPETARLMTAIEEAAAPYADTILPVTDAVHGDWSLGNLLAEGGRITGIVDCAYAGWGTRAIDLATLLHYAYADEYTTDESDTLRDLLRQEILTTGGEATLTITLLYRVMALVEFAIRHHVPEGVAAFTAIGRRILSDLC